MEAEQAWGEDTVALGEGAGREEDRPQLAGHRGPNRKVPMPSPRVTACAAVAIVAVTLVASVLASGSDSGSAPSRDVADPAPSVAVKRSTHVRRREPRPTPSAALKRRPQGKLKRRKGEPVKASAKIHEPAVSVSRESVVEPEPTPIAEPPAGHEALTAPTPAAVEFGM